MGECNFSDCPAEAILERRSGNDRRRGAYLSLFSSQRRRKSKGRRRSDKGGYVDVYDIGSWGVALAVLLLSLLDALLTGMQVTMGKIEEANPLMRMALNRGGMPVFFSMKMAMTALPLAIIVLHKEWALARYAARLCLWSYLLIAVYHIYLTSV
jgi:hypothetical protein